MIGFEKDQKQLAADIIYMIGRYESYNEVNLIADNAQLYAIRFLAEELFKATDWKKFDDECDEN